MIACVPPLLTRQSTAPAKPKSVLLKVSTGFLAVVACPPGHARKLSGALELLEEELELELLLDELELLLDELLLLEELLLDELELLKEELDTDDELDPQDCNGSASMPALVAPAIVIPSSTITGPI